ncbi:MAG TPA: hypothetical protein VFL80_12785 [Thermoanaerobaculia bacterium]|nr:hypothetical protein [Thermoanaerobaculia bacterium]
MPAAGRIFAGSAAGAAIAAWVAPFLRPLFKVPAGGVGFVTVHGYPKGYDYAVVALLVGGAFVGGAVVALFARREEVEPPAPDHRRRFVLATAAIVLVTMLFAHDHPYQLMDPFHEGEHLTPGFLLREGQRPFGEVFFLHGLAVDGGLDALVLGDPPSPRRVRRLHTILDASSLALLVLIAAELCFTRWGVAAAAMASLCGLAAGQLPTFPYHRLAPVLLGTFALLRFAKTGSTASAFVAMTSGTFGVLWSLDTGSYALAAVAVSLPIIRFARVQQPAAPDGRRLLAAAAIACVLPLLLLVGTGASIRHFVVDSFFRIPAAIDAVWALPAPAPPSWKDMWRGNGESLRYYLPPVFYGALLALALFHSRRGDRALAMRILVVAAMSIFLFRTASGRSGWSHTRYGTALFGMAVVAFAIEPLFRRRRWVSGTLAAASLFLLVDVPSNASYLSRYLAGWRARQSHAGLVPYPLRTGKGIYTTPEYARDLAALNGFISTHSAPDAPIFDFAGERAIYYLLERRPPVRCFDINMLSAPALKREALEQLAQNPPACVLLTGTSPPHDGVPFSTRVPEISRWIDENYPRRQQIGRFLVASK